jgi:hypothetical protein
LAASLALSLALLAGCPFGVTVPGENLEPTDTTVSEIAPGSLRVEVTTYGWEFWGQQTHIRVFGEVVNNTGQPLQSVTISGILHDKRGRPVAFGDSRVAPSYLPPGGTGTFEFTGLAKRTTGISPTRLVTTARTISYY